MCWLHGGFVGLEFHMKAYPNLSKQDYRHHGADFMVTEWGCQ